MKVVLFDIDGTLIRGFGVGGRAMRRAAEVVLGERCRDAVVNFGGALDPWIFRQLAQHGGYTIDDLIHAEFRTLYGRLLAEEIERAVQRLTVLPGVLDLLSHMRAARPAVMGLLTGNYAETGAVKLRAAGIDPDWFEISAWGDMAELRPGLVKVALAQLPRTVASEDVIIVGDTVRDVLCARENGCVCVAVTTGGSTADELRAAGADVVLDDLTDPAPLLRLLG
jgi:phosphoglycolate phosphatase